MNPVKEFIVELKETAVYFMDHYPIISGITLILIGIFLLSFQLKKNNSFKMSDHGMASWGVLVNMWALIIMSFIFGIILILRNT
nr:hypothetical protein [uncultured Allomuricauda sp.]